MMQRVMAVALVMLAGVGGVLAAGTIEEALALFPGTTDVAVPFSEEGGAQLAAAIETVKEALGVPDYLDEESESEVGSFPVAAEDKHLVNVLSQAYYTYADVFLREQPHQRSTFLKGKQWGFKGLRMNPVFVAFEQQDGFVAAVNAETDVATLFWANGCWLRWAEPDILAAIKAGIAKKSLAMSERVLELDPSYANYGAYRALAAFWQGLPSDPISALFTGGLMQDYEKVLYYFCHVVDEPSYCNVVASLLDPVCLEYLENRVMFAEYYLMPLGHWQDAERVLQSAVDAPIGESFILYNALSREIAASLLAEVREHL